MNNLNIVVGLLTDFMALGGLEAIENYTSDSEKSIDIVLKDFSYETKKQALLNILEGLKQLNDVLRDPLDYTNLAGYREIVTLDTALLEIVQNLRDLTEGIEDLSEPLDEEEMSP